MAYHSRPRDPLLDSNMQAAIEKRGKELIGITLIVLGLMAAAMIGSYTPDDPNWMVSTDAPVQNLLGRFGASVSAPLFMIVGWGSWGIAVTMLAWGLRFILHSGAERAIARLIFAPIAIAIASVYAATLIPGPAWLATHSFGLGGLFGDTVMGALLTLLPVGSHLAVKLTSLVMAVGMLTLGAYVLGFTRAEMARGIRFALIGVIMVYGGIMTLLGRGASTAVTAARTGQARRAERKQAARLADDIARKEQEAAEVAALAVASIVSSPKQTPGFEFAINPLLEPVIEPERTSLLSRLPSLIRRPEALPTPELIDLPMVDNLTANLEEMPGDDRIRTKIANAVRSRALADAPPPAIDPERPLTNGRGRGPDPLVLDTIGTSGLPPEPPMTRVNAPAPQMVSPVEDTSDQGLQLHTPQAISFQVPVSEPRKVVQNPIRKPPAPSRRAKAEAQPALAFEDKPVAFELPPLNLLANPSQVQRHHLSDEALEQNARMLESVLDDYGVKGEIVSVRPGPVVTMYELEPAPGLKASRVIGLADDIARSMAALSARVSTVPGRSVIGIELPNENREMCVLREVLAARDFGDSNMQLPLALGKGIGGDPIVANLAKMPHLLIAGTTGSGKSVAINTMILSLLYKLTPDECRMIMIDPKMLELSVYDGIPHLLSPVVTDLKRPLLP